jgi:hypothetical protein
MIGIILSIFVLLILLALLLVEVQFRRRPGNKLELTAGDWDITTYDPDRYLMKAN